MAADEVTIRPAVPGDLGAMGRLWVELMDFLTERDEHMAVVENAEEMWKRWTGGRIEDEDALVAVAERGGELVGFCIALLKERIPLYRRRRYGEIIELAVTAKHRGAGVGVRLYDCAVGWFKSRGVDWVCLEVSSANEVGVAFWEKCGFKPFLETMQRDI